MKRRRVRWSRDALDELKETVAHIAQDNPGAAKRVASAIRACGTALGGAAVGRRGRVSGTYERPVLRLPYVIAYAIETLPGDARESLVILRVIHMARDWRDEDWPE